METWLTKFLKRPLNSGKAIIKKKHVNRRGGCGLEVPCEFHIQGHDFSCNWLKQKLQKKLICCADNTFDIKEETLLFGDLNQLSGVLFVIVNG